jgi:glutamine amidotransferase
MKKLVIIKGAGGANFSSVESALKRLEVEYKITQSAKEILEADRVILPGVGIAGYAMKTLKENNLIETIINIKRPLLGICLGQQLLCSFSEEDNIDCLNIIPLKVEKLKNIKIIPQIGWNNLTEISDDKLLKDITLEDNFYFVHSYAPNIEKPYTISTCEYGNKFSAIIRNNNFYGVQFHPEKSGKAGEKILKNFLNL